jgi:hypothetical protein
MNIAELIKRIVGQLPSSSMLVTIVSVDEQSNTCECVPIADDSTKIYDVRIHASIDTATGIRIIPEDNSKAIVTKTQEGFYFLSHAEKVKKVLIDATLFQLNNGSNGNMIIATSLTSELNARITALNQQLATISSAIVTLGGTYPVTPVEALNENQYTNTKVKH